MKPRAAARRLDWAGFATLIGCVVPLLLALTWATQYGWSSTRVESLLVVVGGHARRVPVRRIDGRRSR